MTRIEPHSHDSMVIDELANALRWIANNVKPYGPAQAHATNALLRCGLPVEFQGDGGPNPGCTFWTDRAASREERSDGS